MGKKKTEAYRIPWWQGFAIRIRDNPWLSVMGLMVGVLSILLTILLVRSPELATGKQPTELGQSGDVGPLPLQVTVTEYECGMDEDDLSSELRELKPQEGGLPPIKGQLCFVDTRIRNGSDSSISGGLLGTLIHVGDESYQLAGAEPILAPVIFPDETVEIRYIFDIPETSSPTKIWFAWVDGSDPLEVTL